MGHLADAEGTPEQSAQLEAALSEALRPTYLLVRRLSAGGMGTVFLAREPALQRLVAVKVLAAQLAADPGARSRFEREAQAVARLSHPNVVAIHSLGTLPDGRPYFVMQYVDGPSMAGRVATEGALDVDEGQRIIGHVASALAAAHRVGIIHRDIKPANVLYETESGRVLVSDFGIAAVRPTKDEPARTKLTGTGLAIGTPQYMSPEQVLTEEVTDRTDMYGLGLLAYELLTGHAPFRATTPQELIAAHLRDVPKRLSEMRQDVDPELDSLIARCLAKTPAERPAAREIAARLTPGSETALEWPPPGLAPLQGAVARLSLLYGAGSVLLAAALAGLVAWGERLGAVSWSAGTALLALAGGAGLASLGVALFRTLRWAGQAARAVRDGFGLLTVTEVVCDRTRDTGKLIAGMREYANLDAHLRSKLRRARLTRELAVLVAGVSPLPLLLLVAWLSAGRLVTPTAALLLVFGPGTALLVRADVLDRRERKAVAGGRAMLRRQQVRAASATGLVEPWYASFEEVRRGQVLGRGLSGRPWLSWLAGGTAALAAGLAIIASVPILLIGTLGPLTWDRMMPGFANAVQKLRIAEVVRPFALPVDSTITPLEAGHALWAMDTRQLRFPQRRPPVRYAPWPPVPPGAFPSAMEQSGWSGPSPASILRAAAKGFTADETAYLRSVAESPNWRSFGIVARTAAMDQYGVPEMLSAADTVAWYWMPTPPFTAIKELAYANASRVAYLYAQGRLREAEIAARESISLGFRMADDGWTMMESLIGVVVVGIGRQTLLDLFELRGDPRGPRLRAQHDSVDALVEAASANEGQAPRVRAVNVTAVREHLAREVMNRSRPRSSRIEHLHVLLLAPCTNVKELLFGPSEQVMDVYEEARRDLVRYSSDAVIIKSFLTTPERVAAGVFDELGWQPSVPVGEKLMLGAARLAGGLLRTRRVLGCTVMSPLLQ